MGEFNQAKRAGNYGWPYSRGNNRMYFDYDFKTKESKNRFEPGNITNNSPNNTGIKSLPPIQSSLIWYSYDQSSEFPWLGVGGVNPMSGPIYHAEDFPTSRNSFPEYFQNKWFVYEWMRDWIHVVHLDENHQFIQADPFMPNTEFSHPMDMIFAKGGELYILEYGQKWNSRNLDARLSVISYNAGNRPPIAQFEADQEAGAAPLMVRFSAKQSYDFDQDEIHYTWLLDGKEIETDRPYLDHVFQNPGIYDVSLKVTDSNGESAEANKKILVGNEPPSISIHLSDANTTYWKNKKLKYSIEVVDLEDGTTADTTLDSSKVKVTFNYIPEGEDMILASIGHQQNALPKGLKLINSSDCKACHAADIEVAGPSFQAIAYRYTHKDKEMIIHRVKVGSQGIWGDNQMAPHPQLTLEEIEEMVDYILSLNPEKQIAENLLPLEGSITFNEHLNEKESGQYVLIASYLDEGNSDIEGSSLSAIEKIVFVPPKIELENASQLDMGLGLWESQGRKLVGSIKDGKYIKINPINFNHLTSISIGAFFSKSYEYGGEVEIRSGRKNGKLLGKGNIQHFDDNKDVFKVFEISLEPINTTDTLFLVFKNQEDKNQYTMNGDWIQLNYDK